MQKEAKQYKLALTTFNKKFCNNEEACESFFSRLNILLDIIVKSVGVHIIARLEPETTYMPAKLVVIKNICLLDPSFKIINCLFTCYYQVYSYFSTLQKVSVEKKCNTSWVSITKQHYSCAESVEYSC